MSSGSIRIIQLPEKSSVNTDDYMAVDSSANGTKKVKFTDLLDDNLSTQNKAADAQATGEAINDVSTRTSEAINNVNARVDNMINTQQNASVTTLWTGTLKNKNQSVTLSKSIANFDFIDVYCGGVESTFVRKPVASSITFHLQQQNMSDDASVQGLRWWESGLTISGTTATITKCVQCYWDDFSQVPVVSQSTDGIEVIRIDGVKIGHVENDEIVDARVGANSTTYPTLGDAIRGQVTDLKDEITQLDDRVLVLDGKFALEWEIGVYRYLNNGAEAWASSSARMTIKRGTYISFKAGDTITLRNTKDYQYLYGYSTDGGITWTGGSNTDEPFTLPADCIGFITVTKKDGTSIASDADDVMNNKLIIIRNGTNKVQSNSDDCLAIKNGLAQFGNFEVVAVNKGFSTQWASAGSTAVIASTASTDLIPAVQGDVFLIDADVAVSYPSLYTSVGLRVYEVNANNNTIHTTDITDISEPYLLTINASGTAKLRIYARLTAEPTSIATGYRETFDYSINVSKQLSVNINDILTESGDTWEV